jgi:hypothetical protein
MAIGPNKFVTELAKRLSDRKVGLLAAAAGARPADLANELAKKSDLPELVSFGGYLGGIVQDERNTDWRVLYLDTQLQAWLLVREADVLYNTTVEDKTSPSGERDVIWVRADASVGRGSGSRSVEARFLTGDFSQAEDVEVSPTGGTLAAATGVFCEARTPLCCRRRSLGPR